MAEAPPPNQPPEKPDDDKKQPGKPSAKASHSEGEQTGGRKRRRDGEGGSQSDTTVFYFNLQSGKPVLQPRPTSSDSSESASSRTSIFRITLPANFSQNPALEPSGYRRTRSGSSLREQESREGTPSDQGSSGFSSTTSEEEVVLPGSPERSLTPLSDEEASIRRFIDYTYNRNPLPRDQRDFVCLHTDPTLPWRGDDIGNRSSPSGSSDVSHGIPTRFRSMHGTYLSSADSVESYLGDAASTSSGSVSVAAPVPLSLRKPPPDMPGYADTTSESSSAMCLSDLPVEMPDLESSSGREDNPNAARSGHRQAEPEGLSASERVARMKSIYSERSGEELEAVGRVTEAPVFRRLWRSRSATYPFVRWQAISDTALQVVLPGDGRHGSALRRNLRPRLELSSSSDNAFGMSTVSIM